MKMFVTDRKNKGLEIVAGKYQFIDGMMPVSDTDARLLEPILCRYYGCTIEDVSDKAYLDAQANMDPSLLAGQTRASEGNSQAYVVDAMIAAGEAAGDPNVTGTLGGPAVRIGEEPSLNTAPGASSDPKEVTDQSIGNEAANHAATGGAGTLPVTGPTAASVAAAKDAKSSDGAKAASAAGAGGTASGSSAPAADKK